MGQQDTSIPFRALTPMGHQQQNPMGLLSDVLHVKRQMGVNSDEQHERDALAAFEQYLQADPDDPDGALVKLAQGGHGEAALRFAEQVGKARRANALAAGAQFDTDGKHLERLGQYLQSVGDQPGWDAYRQEAVTIEPRAEAIIPREFTPEAKRTMLGFHMSASEWNTAQRDGLKRVLDGDWQGGLGWALSKAPNAEAYLMTLKAAKQNGAPPEILSLFDPQFSPEAVARAGQAAISPKDQATMAATASRAATDDTRQAADDAEQARHNRAMEARAAAGGGGHGTRENDTERLTDDAVRYNAAAYRVLGQRAIPTRISGADRSRIMNEAAAQSAKLGQSPVQALLRQAAYSGDSKSLANITKMRDGAEAYESKANQQADLVVALSNKVGRTNYPIINDKLLEAKQWIAGDKDTQLFYNGLVTFTTEYAKVMSGSTNSAAASTDSARREASALVSAALSKGTLAATVAQMKREMQWTLDGYDATLAHIGERMEGRGESPQAPAPEAAPANGAAPIRKPIPGIPGGEAELRNGRWIRVK